MNVVDIFTDFFRGNPFDNQIGSLILKSTSEESGLNFDQYLIISNQINQQKEGPKEAFNAIKRRLHNTIQTSPNAALSTLTLWEVCMDNCGYRFQMLFAERNSLNDIFKYCLPNSNLAVSPVVHHKILSIFKKYGEKFSDNVDIQSFSFFYSELLNYGAYLSFDDFPSESVDYNQTPSQEIGRKSSKLKKSISKKLSTMKHAVQKQINPANSHHSSQQINSSFPMIDQRNQLEASYERRMNGNKGLSLTRKENFREMAVSKCELLMSLIEANKEVPLQEIDLETRNLMIELNDNLKDIQSKIVNSIHNIQMTNENISSRETANVNTNLDSELMTLIGLNDEVLQCSQLFQDKYMNGKDFVVTQPNPSTNSNIPISHTEQIPGLKDSVSELEEMQQWMNANNKPIGQNQEIPQMKFPMKREPSRSLETTPPPLYDENTISSYDKNYNLPTVTPNLPSYSKENSMAPRTFNQAKVSPYYNETPPKFFSQKSLLEIAESPSPIVVDLDDYNLPNIAQDNSIERNNNSQPSLYPQLNFVSHRFAPGRNLIQIFWSDLYSL